MADWIVTQVSSTSDWYLSLAYMPRISDRLFWEAGTLKDFPTLSLQSLAVIFFKNGIFKQAQKHTHASRHTDQTLDCKDPYTISLYTRNLQRNFAVTVHICKAMQLWSHHCICWVDPLTIVPHDIITGPCLTIVNHNTKKHKKLKASGSGKYGL